METIKIPPVLIRHLEGLGPRFLRVAKGEKRPFDRGWNRRENLMYAHDPRLNRWLNRGGNYGVAGGWGLIILDADTPELKRLVETMLPPTFRVESPGSGGWHCYYRCDLDKTVRLRREGRYVGEIQGRGKMVVGPNSIHPNGKRYRIIDGSPLAKVTEARILETLSKW
jgi:hypothetical protein